MVVVVVVEGEGATPNVNCNCRRVGKRNRESYEGLERDELETESRVIQRENQIPRQNTK